MRRLIQGPPIANPHTPVTARPARCKVAAAAARVPGLFWSRPEMSFTPRSLRAGQLTDAHTFHWCAVPLARGTTQFHRRHRVVQLMPFEQPDGGPQYEGGCEELLHQTMSCTTRSRTSKALSKPTWAGCFGPGLFHSRRLVRAGFGQPGTSCLELRWRVLGALASDRLAVATHPRRHLLVRLGDDGPSGGIPFVPQV